MNTLRTIGLLCVTLRYVSSKATAARIHCQAPSVFPGDPANLTCFFPEDLRQTRTGFCVFQLNPPDMYEECVLGCSWENGQPVCVGEGFHLVSIVSNEVTVEIPSHKPGMFFCDTLPSDRKDTGLYCNFTLKDAPRTSPRTPPPSSTGPTITTERQEDDGDAPRTSPRTPPPSLTGPTSTTERREDDGGYVAVVIVCLFVIMAIILFCRRKLKARLHCRRKKSNPTVDKEAAQDELNERRLLSTDEVNSAVDKGDKGKLGQVAKVSEIQPLLSTDEVNSAVDKGDKGKLGQVPMVSKIQPLLSTDEVNSAVDKGDKGKLGQVAMVSKIEPLLSTDEVNSAVDKGDKGTIDQVAMVSKIQPLLSTDEVHSAVDKGDKGKLDQFAMESKIKPLLSTDEVNSAVDEGDKAILDQVAMVSKIQPLLSTDEVNSAVVKGDKGKLDQVAMVSKIQRLLSTDLAMVSNIQMTIHDRPDGDVTPKGHPHRRQKDDDGDTVRLLWVGKIGCEKSTTGSTVLGQNVVHTAADSNSVTGDCVRRVVQLGDTRFEIMIAPGLQDVYKTPEEICTIFAQSVVGMHPGPHAVLFFIEGARFDAEYHTAYKRLKALFDDSISRHTILVFTDVKEPEQQQIVLSPKHYVPQSVLRECGHRYLFFNNEAADPQDEMKLLSEVRRLVDGNRGRHYSCNKYSTILENLEEEINRSQEKFDKEDHGGQMYIQKLEDIGKVLLARTKMETDLVKLLQEQEATKGKERSKMAEQVEKKNYNRFA